MVFIVDKSIISHIHDCICCDGTLNLNFQQNEEKKNFDPEKPVFLSHKRSHTSVYSESIKTSTSYNFMHYLFFCLVFVVPTAPGTLNSFQMKRDHNILFLKWCLLSSISLGRSLKSTIKISLWITIHAHFLQTI